jgi:Zn-dependent protease with chaperone function
MPEPTRLQARYFDGRSTRAQVLTVQLSPAGLNCSLCSATWAELEVDERTRHGQRRIRLADGTHFEFEDRTALDRALRQCGHADSLVVGWQLSWRATLASLMALVLLLAASYRWALPWAAEELAQRLPPAAERRLGEYVLEQMGAWGLKPSALKAERQEALRRGLEAAVRAQPGDVPEYRLEFRGGGPLGANAFALPGGILVLTDEMVALAPNDEGLLGVLGHELGHVHHRHMTANLVKVSGLSLMAFVLWGDVSSLLSTAPALLLQAAYSRESETEADTYALGFMKNAGLSGESVAQLFEAVLQEGTKRKQVRKAAQAESPSPPQGHASADHTEAPKPSSETPDEGWGLWATHPPTSERIARYRSL